MAKARPSHWKLSGTPKSDTPPVRSSASPRPMVSVPRVAMIGLMWRRVTMSPFTSPNRAPTPTPATQLTSPPPTKSISRAIIAASTPDRAALAPMDKSSPPEKITKLDPKAAMASTDICLRTLRRFVQDRKPGVVALKKMMTAMTNSHKPASGVAKAERRRAAMASLLGSADRCASSTLSVLSVLMPFAPPARSKRDRGTSPPDHRAHPPSCPP
jgi:hypothetical protein